jgi:hypothetical protein
VRIDRLIGIDRNFYIERLREASEIVVWAWRGWAVRGKLTKPGELRGVREAFRGARTPAVACG